MPSGAEMKVGIIGYGGFGRFLHRAWSGVEGATVTHVADSRDTVTPDGVVVTRSWSELLEGGQVDLVSISTPPSSHAEIAVEALARGCHVLVEKPLATKPEDAVRIIRARDASSCSASVDLMLRFNPIISCIHAWCASSVFGALQRVVVENYAQDESLGPDHWFWDEAESGGILVEHGVHFFDLVHAAANAKPTRVTRRAWRRDSGLTDRVFALVEYDSGLVASFYHAFNRLDDFERTTLRFVFDAAQIDVNGWIPMEGRVVALVGEETAGALAWLPNLQIVEDRGLDATRIVPLADISAPQLAVDRIVTADFNLGMSKETAYLSALQALMSDFVRACREPGHEPLVSLEDGLAALELAVL